MFEISTLFQQILYAMLFLAFFLYGINLMGNSLKELAGSKLKFIIEKTTNTPVKGILMGFIITAILQSSGGVTVIVIALISAGLMTLRQGISVIIGSNIGTTATSILIGVNIGVIAPYLMILGAIVIFFVKNGKITTIGKTLFGFGLLFFGLDNMGNVLEGIANNVAWLDNAFIKMGDYPIVGLASGAIVTALTQSSSAVIGIVQKLHQSIDSFGLYAVIPVVIGSNIGTTITGLLSAIGGNRNGKRAALTHVIFNVVGCCLFMPFLKLFANSMTVIESNVAYFGDNKTATVALIHVIFNLTTTVVLAFFINWLAKLVEKIIPLDEKERSIQRIDCLGDTLIKKAPGLALENAKSVIVDMFDIVIPMFEKAQNFMNHNETPNFTDVISSEDTVDYYDNKLHDYLAKIGNKITNDADVYEQTICFDTIRDLERIADHCVNLVEFMQTRYQHGMSFHSESQEMINHMSKLLLGMLNDALVAFRDNDKKMAARIRATEPQIDELEKKYRRRELNLMASGAIPNTDLHYVDILANLERIGDHANNIADNIRSNSLHSVAIVE